MVVVPACRPISRLGHYINAHFEQVSVSQLGGPEVCPPENLIFKSKSSKMALTGNAFKTNMVWWNLYTFSNKKAVSLKQEFYYLFA